MSSSGHLALVPRLLGWGYAELPADDAQDVRGGAARRLGAGAGARAARRARCRDPHLLALTLLPPALAGLAFERPIERRLGGLRSVAVAQILAGAALLAADRARSGARSPTRSTTWRSGSPRRPRWCRASRARAPRSRPPGCAGSRARGGVAGAAGRAAGHRRRGRCSRASARCATACRPSCAPRPRSGAARGLRLRARGAAAGARHCAGGSSPLYRIALGAGLWRSPAAGVVARPDLRWNREGDNGCPPATDPPMSTSALLDSVSDARIRPGTAPWPAHGARPRAAARRRRWRSLTRRRGARTRRALRRLVRGPEPERGARRRRQPPARRAPARGWSRRSSTRDQPLLLPRLGRVGGRAGAARRAVEALGPSAPARSGVPAGRLRDRLPAAHRDRARARRARGGLARSRAAARAADLRTVEVVADLAAMALERAELLEVESRRARDELRLKRAAEAMSSSLELDDVYRRRRGARRDADRRDAGACSRGSTRAPASCGRSPPLGLARATRAAARARQRGLRRGRPHAAGSRCCSASRSMMHAPIELGPRLYGVLSVATTSRTASARTSLELLARLARSSAGGDRQRDRLPARAAHRALADARLRARVAAARARLRDRAALRAGARRAHRRRPLRRLAAPERRGGGAGGRRGRQGRRDRGAERDGALLRRGAQLGRGLARARARADQLDAGRPAAERHAS